MKQKKSCFVKSKMKVVKHMVGLIVQHMQGFKRSRAMNVQKEEDEEKVAEKKENDHPNLTKKNKNQDLTLPFVVDLLT
jgi:hypothetical protein